MSISMVRAAALTFAAATALPSCARTEAPATFGVPPRAALRTMPAATSFSLSGEDLDGRISPYVNCVGGFHYKGRATGPHPGTFEAMVRNHTGYLQVGFVIASGLLTIRGQAYGKAFGCLGQVPYSATFIKGGKTVGSTSGVARATPDFLNHYFSIVFERG